MWRPAASLVLVVATALAGCAGGDSKSDPPADAPVPAPEATDASIVAEPSAPALAPDRIVLSQCTSFTAGAGPFPKGTGPGSAPPGWEADLMAAPIDAVGYVWIEGYACQRVHVGPYERGPVNIVWDAHSNANIPAACESGGGRYSAVLNVFLVDDEEVAAYLAEAYGMPAAYASVRVATEAVGPFRRVTWAWEEPGQATSRFALLDDGDAMDALARYPRLFWPSGEGLGMLNLTHDRVGWRGDRLADGAMEPPMLLAGTPNGLLYASSRFFSSLSSEGTFTSFANRLCGQPEA